MTAGFDDPADTGYMCAAVYPVLALYSPQNGSINFQPSFEGKNICDGSASGAVRIIPIRFFFPFMRFLFSAPVFRAIKTMVSEKWKKRK
jgi:hypothetical protein